jgi:hypothetical protein
VILVFFALTFQREPVPSQISAAGVKS